MGWPEELRVAAGQRAVFQLQAEDMEGGTVIYALQPVSDGLGASIDPLTGVLTLRPGDDATGNYRIDVVLSDNISSRTLPIEVRVTEAPEASTPVVLVGTVVAVVAIVAAALWFFWMRRRNEDEQ